MHKCWLEKYIIEHPVTNRFGSVYLRPDESLPLADSKGQKVYVLACSAEGASKIRRQEEGFPACIRRVVLPVYVSLFAFFELISLNVMFRATGPAERQLETNGLDNIREGTNFFPVHTEHLHRKRKNSKSYDKMYDIFINCNWVVNRWQYTFTHKQHIEQHK